MTLPIRQPRRRRGLSLQAAAARHLPDSSERVSSIEPDSSGGFSWQTEAWNIYRRLGLMHYAMSFVRDNVSLLDFYAAEIPNDPEEEPTPVDLDHPAAVEVERLSHGPYGTFSDLAAELVVHTKVAGEGRLSVRYERNGEPVAGSLDAPPEGADEVWEVLTPQTLRKRKNDPNRRPAESVRIWKPDPERPEFPDSPVRAVLTECTQLLYLQQQVTGAIQSRLHRGILAVPEELDPAPPAPANEGDDEMSPLMRDMFTTFNMPVKDPQAAGAIMPYLLFGKSELLEAVRHIDISGVIDPIVLELADHLGRLIAAGIDLPAERLTGIDSLNHWSAWLIDDITYAQHLAPAVDLVVHGLVQAWLRPAWAAAGLDADRFDLFIDTQNLTSRVRKGEDAVKVYRLGELSGAALRREMGFDESDAPTDDDPGLRGQVRSEDVDVPANRDNVVPGPPSQSVQAAATIEDLGARLAAIDAEVLDDLMDLADRAVAEQSEEAESRLLEAMAAAGISVDTEPLAQALADANISPAEIVPDDAFDGITERAAERMADGLAAAEAAVAEATGQSGFSFDDAAVALAAGGLAASLTEWLRSRWFSDTPTGDEAAARFARHGRTPDLPGGLVMDAMTEAGGGLGQTAGSRGVANAATVEQWLLESGLAVRGYRWIHGGPAEPFRPHQRLDGVEFTGRDDPRIENRTNSWPHGSVWLPGDHRGCQCRWQKILLPAAEVRVG